MNSDVCFTPAGLAIITALLGAMAGALGLLWRTMLASQGRELAALGSAHQEVIGQRDTYRAIADRAIARLELMLNDQRARDGRPPLPSLAPVFPEHHSPVTPQQAETARVATLRARLVAGELSLGVPSTANADPNDDDPADVTGYGGFVATTDEVPVAETCEPAQTMLQRLRLASVKLYDRYQMAHATAKEGDRDAPA